ncbi:MAG TPA: cohesin domain-containing protein, partial [Chitinophagales bacterium]|nr:cohesin domain-containing protein [Chitinophagales bacterium]
VFTPVNCNDNNSCTADSCENGVCVYTPLCFVGISGSIVSETGAAVPTVTVSYSGSYSGSMTTGNDGIYNLSVPEDGNYTVTPSKNNDVTENNGITTLDLVLIQRRILNIQNLSTPYKIIAADVNGSNSVTTFDIVLARAVILDVSQSFPGGRLWTFVRSDYVFGNPQNPFPYPSTRTYSNLNSTQTNQNFIGLKLGDVNNSWDPNTPKTSAAGDLQFVMDEYNVLPGDEIIVPVKVKDFSGITGYQFTLSWDENVLSLLEVTNQSLSGYYGEHRTGEGLLTTSWMDAAGGAVTLHDDAVVFELKFKVIGQTGSISEISIGSELTLSEAYNENLELLNVIPTNGIVKVSDVSSVSNQQSTVYHLQAVPNPFSNTTNIIFAIPRDETVSLVIYDMLGKEVKRIQADFKAGKHQIEWAGDDDAGKSLSKGLYHVRLEAGNQAMGLKVELVK